MILNVSDVIHTFSVPLTDHLSLVFIASILSSPLFLVSGLNFDPFILNLRSHIA
ncbi:hypothetical protein X975_20024, partial [Stegodyphus mimosarum]